MYVGCVWLLSYPLKCTAVKFSNTLLSMQVVDSKYLLNLYFFGGVASNFAKNVICMA